MGHLDSTRPPSPASIDDSVAPRPASSPNQHHLLSDRSLAARTPSRSPPRAGSMQDVNRTVQPYHASEYFETANTQNRVSRKAHLCGTSNIVLGGKCIIHANALIRADLRRTATSTASSQMANHVVTTGRYCVLGEGAVIRPPYKTYKGVFSYYPVKMGDFVHIGANTVNEATNIGTYVDVGRDCIIGRFSTIRDCARIADGAVLPPYTTVPSGQLWAGNPAKHVADLPETWQELHENRCREYYSKYRPAAGT
ncbi:unnamed protein product [Parajaminaea phylloscopi]